MILRSFLHVFKFKNGSLAQGLNYNNIKKRTELKKLVLKIYYFKKKQIKDEDLDISLSKFEF